MRRILILYFLFCSLFFALFASGFIDSQDGFQYLAVARRIYYDGTPALPTERFPDDNIHMSGALGNDQVVYSPTGLGYSVALLPAVVAEDLINRVAGVEPTTAFPLENDWPVLLFASMANAFIGAILVTLLFSYFRLFGLSTKASLILSFLLFISSNLFVYAKHSFAHMLFATTMMACFYGFKKYQLSQQKRWLVFVGASYSLVVLSYNPTYLLVLPSLVLYYVLLHYRRISDLFNVSKHAETLMNAVIALLGFVPGGILYWWYNWMRFSEVNAGLAGYSGSVIQSVPPAMYLVEGLWSLLLSPGKSVFLFSPLLLIVIFFWHRWKKEWMPELVSFGLLFLIYLYVIGSLMGGADFPVWHGDSSWGPRYMLPVVPGLLLIAGLLINQMRKWERLVFVLPLFLLGLYIELVGLLLPYQVRFKNIADHANINNELIHISRWGNQLAGYSPVFIASKNLAHMVLSFDQLYPSPPYYVRYIDGFARPFQVGPGRYWREIYPFARVRFQQPSESPAETFGFRIRNHVLEAGWEYPLQVTVENQNRRITHIILPDEEQEMRLSLSSTAPEQEVNLRYQWVGTTSAMLEKRQVAFIQDVTVNTDHQSLQTITYPYVSPVSTKLTQLNYGYWGYSTTNPWDIWHMHSIVYESTFDLWWLRPLHYWDLPQRFFALLFALDVSGILVTAYLLIRRVNMKTE